MSQSLHNQKASSRLETLLAEEKELLGYLRESYAGSKFHGWSRPSVKLKLRFIRFQIAKEERLTGQ